MEDTPRVGVRPGAAPALLELPAAARLASWGSAALVGRCSPDDAAASVHAADDPPHRVTGLPGEPGAVSVAYALGRLRALGATGLRLVLPRPGDVSALPGPARFNTAALEAGAAVLAVGADLGLLPAGRAQWQSYAVGTLRPTPRSLRDADRELTSAVRRAAEELAALDVARWDPAAAGLLGGPVGASPLPRTAPAPAHALLAKAQRLVAVAEVALASDGGALQASAMARRRTALGDLADAARRAIEAACSTTDH